MFVGYHIFRVSPASYFALVTFLPLWLNWAVLQCAKGTSEFLKVCLNWNRNEGDEPLLEAWVKNSPSCTEAISPELAYSRTREDTVTLVIKDRRNESNTYTPCFYNVQAHALCWEAGRNTYRPCQNSSTNVTSSTFMPVEVIEIGHHNWDRKCDGQNPGNHTQCTD